MVEIRPVGRTLFLQGVAGVVLESGNVGIKYLVKNTGFGVWANSHSNAFARIYRMKNLFRVGPR
jgi:hypothetical protein